MDIGKPRRVHRVEPLKEPVPGKPETPARKPAPPVRPRRKVPAK